MFGQIRETHLALAEVSALFRSLVIFSFPLSVILSLSSPQTYQCVRPICWISATCFRVWKSSIVPILLHLSKPCRSAPSTSHFSRDSELSSFQMENCVTVVFFFYRFSLSIHFIALESLVTKYRTYIFSATTCETCFL